MTFQITLPKYVTPKPLVDGSVAYYWNCPSVYRKAGFPEKHVALGVDLTQGQLNKAAQAWNEALRDWRMQRKAAAVQSEIDDAAVSHKRYGTFGWLLDHYQTLDAFTEHVAEPNRKDYRLIFDRVGEIRTESTDQPFGQLRINEFGVKGAQRVYKALFDAGARRSAEKAVTYCATAWRRMYPLYPQLFRKDVPNPWEGVTLKRRKKARKAHADRKTVYRFARRAVEYGRPELGAAAVLAFEWFLRPRNIGQGHAQWSGYRSKAAPTSIEVRHAKTGETALHPLEYVDDAGERVLLYGDAEEILRVTPRRGLSIVTKLDGTNYGSGSSLPQAIRKLAKQIGMDGFTLDQARHGGLTELEEAGLTEGQGMALSKHRTSTAYRGYAKD